MSGISRVGAVSATQRALLLGQDDVDRIARYRHGFIKGQPVKVNEGVKRGIVCHSGRTGQVTGFTKNGVVVKLAPTVSDPFSKEVEYQPYEIN